MAGWQLMVAAALVLAIVTLLILVLVRKKTAQTVWGVGVVLGVTLGLVSGKAVTDARMPHETAALAAPAAPVAEPTPAPEPAKQPTAEPVLAPSTTAPEPTPVAEPPPVPEAAPAVEPPPAPEAAPEAEPPPVPAPTPEADPPATPPDVPSAPSGDSEERTRMLWQYREEARQVATDPKRCSDTEEVAGAWAKVRQITRNDEIYRRGYILTKWLERCRARIERQRTLQLTYDRVLARREFDTKLQKRLRESGRSPVWVRVTGPTDARLWITGGGFDGASEQEILDGGLRDELTKLGFLRVTFVHGSERNVHHFEPEREADMVRRDLERLGIADPLKL